MRGVSALGITCLDLYVWFGGELSLSALVSVGIVEVEAVFPAASAQYGERA